MRKIFPYKGDMLIGRFGQLPEILVDLEHEWFLFGNILNVVKAFLGKTRAFPEIRVALNGGRLVHFLNNSIEIVSNLVYLGEELFFEFVDLGALLHTFLLGHLVGPIFVAIVDLVDSMQDILDCFLHVVFSNFDNRCKIFIKAGSICSFSGSDIQELISTSYFFISRPFSHFILSFSALHSYSRLRMAFSLSAHS